MYGNHRGPCVSSQDCLYKQIYNVVQSHGDLAILLYYRDPHLARISNQPLSLVTTNLTQFKYLDAHIFDLGVED